MKKIILAATAAILLFGCTENQRAKQFGGTVTVDLPKEEKLVIVTWKDDNMWYLTRPFKDGEEPETYKFKEESSWGLAEGTVIIKESRDKYIK